MNKWMWIAAGVILSFCLVAADLNVAPASEDTPNNDADPTVAELLKRIESLEERVAELESRQPFVLADPGRKPPLRGWQPAPSLPDIPPRGEERLPEGWSRKRFNGQYYYIVPLGSPDGAAAEPAPQSDPTLGHRTLPATDGR